MSQFFVTTDRLHIVQASVLRVDDWVRYFVRNREHLAPWSHFGEEFFTTDYWRERLQRSEEDTALGRDLHLWLERREDPGGIVGGIRFSNVVGGLLRGCHLGYSLDRDLEGAGYMTEALRVTIPRAAERLVLHRIMAGYVPENARSGRLLQRLGFEVEGYAREYLWINGAWRDHVQTALILPDAPTPESAP